MSARGLSVLQNMKKENEPCSLILRLCRFSLTERLHFLGDCFKLKKREKEKKSKEKRIIFFTVRELCR